MTIAEARKFTVASHDDWQNAYEEAAGHLEYLAGIQTDQTLGEREAMRLLAKRLRRSAARMPLNAPGERPGATTQKETNAN